MTTGLNYLFVYRYFLQRTDPRDPPGDSADLFESIAAIEWDTMLFFFG